MNWPVGLGGKGNEGVTGLVKQTPGSIGYVELAYANQNKLAVAALKNKDGNFVEASIESTTAAAAGVASMPADFRVSITERRGQGRLPDRRLHLPARLQGPKRRREGQGARQLPLVGARTTARSWPTRSTTRRCPSDGQETSAEDESTPSQ